MSRAVQRVNTPQYLNGATEAHLHQLYVRMLNWGNGEIDVCFPGSLTGVTRHELVRYVAADASVHSGAWWLLHITCTILRRFMSPDGDLPNMNHCYETTVQSTVLRIWPYHLTWRLFDVTRVIPDGLGHGPSFDHICGSKSCHRQDHVQPVLQHQLNVDRIGCTGVTLLVFEGAIIQEIACPHSQQVETSCRRVRIISISMPAALHTKNRLDKMCDLDD